MEAVCTTGHRLGTGPAGPDPAGRPAYLVFGAERTCIPRLLAGLYFEKLLSGSPSVASAILPGETYLFSPLGHISPGPAFQFQEFNLILLNCQILKADECRESRATHDYEEG